MADAAMAEAAEPPPTLEQQAGLAAAAPAVEAPAAAGQPALQAAAPEAAAEQAAAAAAAPADATAAAPAPSGQVEEELLEVRWRGGQLMGTQASRALQQQHSDRCAAASKPPAHQPAALLGRRDARPLRLTSALTVCALQMDEDEQAQEALEGDSGEAGGQPRSRGALSD
jgi:hypothetical protein